MIESQDLVVAGRQVQWMIELKFQWVIGISLQHLNFGGCQGVNVSMWKERRRLQERWLIACWTATGPRPTTCHRQADYNSQWTNALKLEKWPVLFSDELRLSLTSSNGQERVWRSRKRVWYAMQHLSQKQWFFRGLWRKLIIPTFLHFCVIRLYTI